jgi:hypothetical protein
MKLYTEEQMNRAMDLHKANVKKESIFDYFNPIELPSNEEIRKESIEFYDNNGADFYFLKGAKWVIEQIKRQGSGH